MSQVLRTMVTAQGDEHNFLFTEQEIESYVLTRNLQDQITVELLKTCALRMLRDALPLETIRRRLKILADLRR